MTGRTAKLALANGSVFTGTAFGAEGEVHDRSPEVLIVAVAQELAEDFSNCPLGNVPGRPDHTSHHKVAVWSDLGVDPGDEGSVTRYWIDETIAEDWVQIGPVPIVTLVAYDKWLEFVRTEVTVHRQDRPLWRFRLSDRRIGAFLGVIVTQSGVENPDIRPLVFGPT